MVVGLTHPFSIFQRVFTDLRLPPLSISVSDEATDWLLQLSREEVRDSSASAKRLLLQFGHRELYLRLLQILLPCEFSGPIEELMILKRSKWEYVDSQDFVPAAETMHRFDSKLKAIAQQMDRPMVMGREHLEQLFERLRKQANPDPPQ